MKTLSNTLFVILVFACFASVAFMLPKKEDQKYIIRDRHSMDAHLVFDNKKDADEYVKTYKNHHDYIIEERKN